MSSLGAGKAKGAVLRLMPHSLSTGVAAEGAGTEGLLRLNRAGAGCAAAGPHRPPMGSISRGDFIGPFMEAAAVRGMERQQQQQMSGPAASILLQHRKVGAWLQARFLLDISDCLMCLLCCLCAGLGCRSYGSSSSKAAVAQGDNRSKASNQQDGERAWCRWCMHTAPCWLLFTRCIVLFVSRCVAGLGDPEVVLEAGLVVVLVVAAVGLGQGR